MLASDPLTELVAKLNLLEGQLDATSLLLAAAVEAIVEGESTRSSGDTVRQTFEKVLRDAQSRLETSDLASHTPEYVRGFEATARKHLDEFRRFRRRR